MPLSMHDASVPVFRQGLTSLAAILEKAAAHAAARKIEPAVLLQARLYPDMLPLTVQVQIASDRAKGVVSRLAGVENPKMADTETTFEELQARVARTLDFIGSVDAARFEGSETKEIVIQARDRTVTYVGRPYLLHEGLPNFWFHVTTAYAILRHNGIEIGKRDFIGTY